MAGEHKHFHTGGSAKHSPPAKGLRGTYSGRSSTGRRAARPMMFHSCLGSPKAVIEALRLPEFGRCNYDSTCT
jgi:hypothetical protein